MLRSSVCSHRTIYIILKLSSIHIILGVPEMIYCWIDECAKTRFIRPCCITGHLTTAALIAPLENPARLASERPNLVAFC